MDSNYEFKGEIVENLIKERDLSKIQAKKLICIGTVTDGHLNDYSERSQWYLETAPDEVIHKLFYDLFLYTYDLKLPISFYNTKKDYRRSGFVGSNQYEEIVEDLLNFSPTFKTIPEEEKDIHNKNPSIKFILEEEDWLKKIGLRLLFDFEGFITTNFTVRRKSKIDKYQFQFRSELGISVSNRKLANEMKELAASQNLHMNIKKDSRRWDGIGTLSSENKETVSRFKGLGGFLTDIKERKSKYNKNIPKQSILEVCCKTLEKQSCSKYFRKRKKAEKYRENFKENLIKEIRKHQENKIDGTGRI